MPKVRKLDYPSKFYQRIQSGADRSARHIVPIVLDLIEPKSVVDVGCGTGAWLSNFREHGIEDILGIDGHDANDQMLRIPMDKFRSIDLSKPFAIERQFDLVLSVEVAEHLPAESADSFVRCLTLLGPVVLFSAAIPLQGGAHHVNEQWPEYWANKFGDRGYLVLDYLRRALWQNEEIEWWYAQNLLIFAREDQVASHDRLREISRLTRREQLAVIHPRFYLQAIDPRNMTLERVLPALPTLATRAVRGTVKRALRRWF